MKVDFKQLTRDGYTPIPGLIDTDSLEEFEAVIASLGDELVRRMRLTVVSKEPLIDLFRVGGDFRALLYTHLKHLKVLHAMSSKITQGFEEARFFEWMGAEAPLFWSTLRADIPGEETYLLPIHQDYASTRCHNAWRIWVPLRPVNENDGSMLIVPGSHRLGHLPHETGDPKFPFVETCHYEGLDPKVLSLPAGDAVLFHPLLLHRSVPSRSNRMKFVLLVQIQDLATLLDPDDPDDPLAEFLNVQRERDRAREQD